MLLTGARRVDDLPRVPRVLGARAARLAGARAATPPARLTDARFGQHSACDRLPSGPSRRCAGARPRSACDATRSASADGRKAATQARILDAAVGALRQRGATSAPASPRSRRGRGVSRGGDLLALRGQGGALRGDVPPLLGPVRRGDAKRTLAAPDAARAALRALRGLRALRRDLPRDDRGDRALGDRVAETLRRVAARAALRAARRVRADLREALDALLAGPARTAERLAACLVATARREPAARAARPRRGGSRSCAGEGLRRDRGADRCRSRARSRAPPAGRRGDPRARERARTSRWRCARCRARCAGTCSRSTASRGSPTSSATSSPAIASLLWTSSRRISSGLSRGEAPAPAAPAAQPHARGAARSRASPSRDSSRPTGATSACCATRAGTSCASYCALLGESRRDARARASSARRHPERIALSDADLHARCSSSSTARTCAEDLGRGRIYLPAEDLARFGAARRRSSAAPGEPGAARGCCVFEAERARALLRAGEPLLADAAGAARLAVAGFAAGGHAALDALERVGFDVPRRARPRRGGATSCAGSRACSCAAHGAAGERAPRRRRRRRARRARRRDRLRRTPARA